MKKVVVRQPFSDIRGIIMSKIPVSVCIISKNEEKHIEECLIRIKRYGFEIVVVDTGSTDNTVSIAKHYADRVESFEWIDDFSAARNYCASLASNNWIMCIDCDEYIENVDISALRIFMQKNKYAIGCIHLKNLRLIENEKYGCSYDDVERFYNRNYYEYTSPIHEQITPRQKILDKDISKFLLPMEVTHYGYAISKEEMKKKQERNLNLLYKAYENKETAYLNFQIGQSLLILDRFDEAINYFESGLEYHESFELLYIQEMIVSLAKAYICAGQKEKALQHMEYYEPYCENARFVHTYANVYMDCGESLKALMKYVKATMMPDTNRLGDDLIYCYRHIIELYHQFGADEQCDTFKRKLNELTSLPE